MQYCTTSICSYMYVNKRRTHDCTEYTHVYTQCMLHDCTDCIYTCYCRCTCTCTCMYSHVASSACNVQRSVRLLVPLVHQVPSALPCLLLSFVVCQQLTNLLHIPSLHCQAERQRLLGEGGAGDQRVRGLIAKVSKVVLC